MFILLLLFPPLTSDPREPEVRMGEDTCKKKAFSIFPPVSLGYGAGLSKRSGECLHEIYDIKAVLQTKSNFFNPKQTNNNNNDKPQHDSEPQILKC